jgi:multisubunit Na+/H+ antiporter MnhB subunit
LGVPTSFVGTPQFGKLMKLPIENYIENFLFLRVLILVFVVHLSPDVNFIEMLISYIAMGV